MRLKCIFLLLLVSCILHASDERQQIQKRIKPVGNVHIQEEHDVSVSIDKNKPVTLKRSTGKKIYEKYCITCHRDGIAGAPEFRNVSKWSARLSEKTIDDLVNSAMKGLNAMPAKGTCFECNEADIKAAVRYMMPHHD